LKVVETCFRYAQVILVLRDHRLFGALYPSPKREFPAGGVCVYPASYSSQYATRGTAVFFQNALYHRRRTTGRIGFTKTPWRAKSSGISH